MGADLIKSWHSPFIWAHLCLVTHSTHSRSPPLTGAGAADQSQKLPASSKINIDAQKMRFLSSSRDFYQLFGSFGRLDRVLGPVSTDSRAKRVGPSLSRSEGRARFAFRERDDTLERSTPGRSSLTALNDSSWGHTRAHLREIEPSPSRRRLQEPLKEARTLAGKLPPCSSARGSLTNVPHLHTFGGGWRKRKCRCCVFTV